MSNGSRVLVVGGTGPSGVPIVNEFLRAGASVSVYHSGRHEAGFEGDVEHLHGDARDPGDIADKLVAREWDIAVCTSGRLRALAETLAGRTRRLVGITGQPVYLGTMRPTPEGILPLPIPESAPRQYDASNYTGKVAAGEDQLLAQHKKGDFEAVVVRYPGVFGPRGPLSHEWAIVKRILAGRSQMAMPNDGMAYFQRGFVENLGRLVFLAATRPEAAGECFNAGDEQVLNARHVAELIADELGASLEFVGVPARYCRGSYPLAEKSSLILDMSRARGLLGYRDVLGVEAATRLTARWLADNPQFGAEVSPAFGGTLDYATEDRVIAAARKGDTELANAVGISEASG
jgi:nucleoside-diphosphate-sugar epimerase